MKPIDFITPLHTIPSFRQPLPTLLKCFYLYTVGDLLNHMPVAYETVDNSIQEERFRGIAEGVFEIQVDRIEGAVVSGRLAAESSVTGIFTLNSHCSHHIAEGSCARFLYTFATGYEPLPPNHSPLVPIYSAASETLPHTLISSLIKRIMTGRCSFPAVIPEHIERQAHMVSSFEAYRMVHFPESPEESIRGQQRIAFETAYMQANRLRTLHRWFHTPLPRINGVNRSRTHSVLHHHTAVPHVDKLLEQATRSLWICELPADVNTRAEQFNSHKPMIIHEEMSANDVRAAIRSFRENGTLMFATTTVVPLIRTDCAVSLLISDRLHSGMDELIRLTHQFPHAGLVRILPEGVSAVERATTYVDCDFPIQHNRFSVPQHRICDLINYIRKQENADVYIAHPRAADSIQKEMAGKRYRTIGDAVAIDQIPERDGNETIVRYLIVEYSELVSLNELERLNQLLQPNDQLFFVNRRDRSTTLTDQQRIELFREAEKALHSVLSAE